MLVLGVVGLSPHLYILGVGGNFFLVCFVWLVVVLL